MARAKDVKAKEKKQKLILAGLGVVLLIVLAIELPGLLSSGGSTAAPTTTDATTTTATSGAVPVPAASAGATISSSEVVFTASVEKLSSLGFFKAKDPFDSHGVGATPAADTSASQAAAPPTSPPAAAATGNVAAKAAAAAVAAAAAGGAASSGPVFGTIQGPAPAKSGVSIPSAKFRFNGRPLTVALGATFPKSKPYFRLAGVTPDGVKISVLKGSLADGSAAIELLEKRPLTLVNTANGSRFRIELLSAPKKT